MIRKTAVSVLFAIFMALSVLIASPITNSTAADNHNRVAHSDIPTPTPTSAAGTDSNPSGGGNGGG